METPTQLKLRCPYYFHPETRCQNLECHVSQLMRHLRRHEFYFCSKDCNYFVGPNARQEYEQHRDGSHNDFRCLDLWCPSRDPTCDGHPILPDCNSWHDMTVQQKWLSLFAILFPDTSLPRWDEAGLFDESAVMETDQQSVCWTMGVRPESHASMEALIHDGDLYAMSQFINTSDISHSASSDIIESDEVKSVELCDQKQLWSRVKAGEEARLALNTGVSLNSTDENDRTPFPWTMGNWDESMKRFLLSRQNIDVNSQDSSGQTPLVSPEPEEGLYESVAKVRWPIIEPSTAPMERNQDHGIIYPPRSKLAAPLPDSGYFSANSKKPPVRFTDTEIISRTLHRNAKEGVRQSENPAATESGLSSEQTDGRDKEEILGWNRRMGYWQMHFDSSGSFIPPGQADAPSFDVFDVNSTPGNINVNDNERKEPVMEAKFPPYRDLSPVDQFDHIIGRQLAAHPSFNEISRQRASDVCKITFEVYWDPISFIAEQGYDEEAGEAFERAITLTGLANTAQALTCAQYLGQTWPVTGPEMVEVIKEVIRKSRHSSVLRDRTALTAWLEDSKFIVQATGNGDSVVEIGEQLGWLGSALRSSPYETRLSYCSPFIRNFHVAPDLTSKPTDASLGEMFCKIDFETEQPDEFLVPQDGQCWHNLFANSVIVRGYPIPYRPQRNTGVEIPLNIMAVLAQAGRATTFDGRVVVKGFCTMLVPTEVSPSLTLWHMIFNSDGSHISYSDPRIRDIPKLRFAESSYADLERCRHIVGWCSKVHNYTGAPNINYSIDPSGLGKPQRGCAFENVSFSAGKFITACATVAVGKRDRAVHLKSRDDYLSQLQWVAKKHVVLFDVEDRHGWLVDGASALLHLVRASLRYNESDGFESELLFNSKDIHEATEPYTGRLSSINVLLNRHNRQLKLYAKPDKIWEEQVSEKDQEIKEISKCEKSYLRFEDRVQAIYYSLEEIIAHQAHTDSESGIGFKVKSSPRRSLEGFDFFDVATGEDPFWPKIITLEATGKGWVDFTRAIHAVTLFGKGFGELFKPVESSQLCPVWRVFPKKHDHLAVCISDMQGIITKQGSQKSSPWRIVDNIYWHQPEQIFGPCQCPYDYAGNHADRVQVLLPSSLVNLWGRGCTSPRKLDHNGAVIFGHSWSCPLKWPDYAEEAISSLSLKDASPNDSGFDETATCSSSVGSIGVSGVSSTQQSRSEGISTASVVDSLGSAQAETTCTSATSSQKRHRSLSQVWKRRKKEGSDFEEQESEDMSNRR